MMPIEYVPSAGSRRNAPEDAFVFTLAASGRGHVVMNQSSSAAENEDLWHGIQDFRWRLPVSGVKPGAEVLAYAQPKKQGDSTGSTIAMAESIAATIEEDPEAAMRRLEEMRGEQNRNSLIVARTFGKGRVLMLNTDSMWRLRSKDGDQLHHRFWGQVMRWGAGEKLRAGNLYVRIGTDQLRYGAGETVRAFVRISDENHNGVDGLDPRLVIRPPDSRAKEKGFAIYPKSREGSAGFYECEINGCTKPGEYEMRLECSKGSQLLGRRFPMDLATCFIVVTSRTPTEEVDITATREFAERMAKSTGGRVLTPTEYLALDEDFGGGSKQIADRVEYQLWSLPPLFLAIVALLTTEWILRKRASLA